MSTATVNTRDANSKLVPIEQQQPMNPTYASQYFKALKIHQFDENQKTGSRHSRYPDSGYNYKQAIGEAKDLYWNSSGTKLAVVRSDYDIRIWNSPDRSKDIKYTTEIKGLHEHRVESVSWDPTCADVFATCADDSQGRVKIWDSKSKLSIKEFTTGAANKKCAFSPDGKFLAVLRKDNVILLFDVTDTPCKIGQLKEDIRINNFCISNDGTQLFTAFSNGCVNVYTIGSPGAHATPDNSLYEITLLTSLKGPECAAESMGFDPQGEWLAVSYEEGSVLIWSMTDYLCVRCLQKEL